MHRQYKRTLGEEKRLLDNYRRGLHPSYSLGIKVSHQPIGGGVGTPPSHISRADFKVLKEHGSLDPANRIPPTGKPPIIRGDVDRLIKSTFHPNDAYSLSESLRRAINKQQARGWLAKK